MNNTLNTLQPEALWKYFSEISSVPRPSKKEERILEYLIAFATTHQLSWEQDSCGNVLIRKPAAVGFENLVPVVLQCHVDMVCEKNADVEFDFLHDPIVPKVDGEWVVASGTTLGADNGVGMAAMLAILQSNNISHGPLECLFTIDEETGLTGAFGLDADLLQGRIMLNLDSADEGELCIGCAGGIDTEGVFSFETAAPLNNQSAYSIKVSGLLGGHSGDDINRGRGNAIKILARLLWNIDKQFHINLASIQGGNLRNAIAREALAVVSVPEHLKTNLEEFFKGLSNEIIAEWDVYEPEIKIELLAVGMPKSFMMADFKKTLISMLFSCPHGVLAMSANIPGLVETSTNLASVKTLDGKVIVATSQRSALESGKKLASQMMASSFELAGATYKHGDGYPGWKPDVASQILKTCAQTYKELFGIEPKVLAIHAGLECGVIGGKYPGMDMISFGPTIKGAHSPDERVEIASVKKFWEFTLAVLKNLPKRD